MHLYIILMPSINPFEYCLNFLLLFIFDFYKVLKKRLINVIFMSFYTIWKFRSQDEPDMIISYHLTMKK